MTQTRFCQDGCDDQCRELGCVKARPPCLTKFSVCEGCDIEPACEARGKCTFPAGRFAPNKIGQTVIEAREDAHGPLLHQAALAQDLKNRFRGEAGGWSKLSPEQRESIDMIAVKLSRILVGNPNHADHWTDLSGYATLISNLLTKGTPL